MPHGHYAGKNVSTNSTNSVQDAAMMKDGIRLNAVGDVMLGDLPLTLGFGVRSSLRKGIIKDPFGKTKGVLSDCDICMGNLETVLSGHGFKEKDIRSAQMRGDSSGIDLLKDAGFNVMSVANNHAMQHGPEAFKETEKGLVAGGVSPIGLAGADNRCVPFFMEKNRIRVCFLGYSLRPEKYCPETLYARARVCEIVEDIKVNKARCDVVVVSLHWGDEFVQVPSPGQVRDAHSFVDAGASLIIGHHSHTIQGIEEYAGGVIAYSLGNFVFDFWQDKLRETLILQCELSKSGVESFRIIPAHIDTDYCPVILTGHEAEKVTGKVNGLSNMIGTIDLQCEKQAEKYVSTVKANLSLHQAENRFFFLKNIFNYESWVVTQSIKNFVGSRLR